MLLDFYIMIFIIGLVFMIMPHGLLLSISYLRYSKYTWLIFTLSFLLPFFLSIIIWLNVESIKNINIIMLRIITFLFIIISIGSCIIGFLYYKKYLKTGKMKIFQKEMEANKKLIEHNDNYTSLKIIHNNNIQQFGNLYRHSSFYQLNKDRLEIFENLISTTKEIIDTLDKEKKTL